LALRDIVLIIFMVKSKLNIVGVFKAFFLFFSLILLEKLLVVVTLQLLDRLTRFFQVHVPLFGFRLK